MTNRLTQLSALGDPHRLAVVDALARSDRSPAELADEVGLSSNLLAHHLGVLERAGLVSRSRSGGDARRTYASLVWSPLVDAVTADAGGPTSRSDGVPRVVFVCTGNSARSPIAAALLASQGFSTASAGTVPADSLHAGAVDVLARRGLEPLAPAPAPLDRVRREGDLVISVCDRAHESGAGVAHWSIPGAGADAPPEAFARIVDLLVPRIRRLADALAPAPST